jgi:Transglycosylase SLT domain
MRFVFACAALCFVSQQAICGGGLSLPEGKSGAGIADAGLLEEVAIAIPQQELAPPVYSRHELCDAVVAAAEAHDLPIGFLIRLIWQESGFDTQSVSRAGALGIAQFMPGTAAEMGVDPFDPTEALPASARFLRALQQQFGNHGLAAAAYNAGAGRVRNWLTKRSRLPQETREYVYIITGRKPEQWIGTGQKSATFKIPAGTRCQLAAATVVAAEAARWTRRATKPRGIRVRLEPAAPVVATDTRLDAN